MKNNTFAEIAQVIREKDSITLYPHENMDGDAFGSCVALAKALGSMGKTTRIYYTDEIPDNLKFMDKGYVITDSEEAEKADIAMLVDCGELSRIGEREESFLKAPLSICIDHHGTTEAAFTYNYVEPEAAATGQLVFTLLKELGINPDREIGNAIYAAIITDTGKFQYANTQKESHLITAELFDWGIDHIAVSQEIYESNRFERLLIEAYAMNTLSMSSDGRVAICFADRRAFEETGAEESETENVVGKLRAIKGVEVAAFLKEKKDGRINISLRSKKYVDVSKIASRLGGGGHTRAAGATIKNIGMEEALDRVRKAIAEEIHE